MKTTDYTVIRSRRRSLELRLYPDSRIEVRVPLRASAREVEDFIASKSAWLQARLRGQQLRPPRIPLQYRHGEEHLFLGQHYPLSLARAARPATALQQGSLCLLAPEPDNPERIARQLERWYRQQADGVFNRLIDHHFPFFAVRGHIRPQLRIRSMKSRWGSLSSLGYINLNLELIKTPLHSIEYVVIHELCHLEHMNHGPAFQALMSQCLPDWRRRKRELNEMPLR
ncbi:SprT family zinc-dependent metalloprotease [Alcanivorax sp. 1008]|uniref:M48 family metallopeptidase n=1 Tax=Alcanivorax sp. 1008 TaxID=2816853 RepID=UPI001D9B93FB|nr:M48 family metallopeptidase [Alcanivorax sp. 1008]